MPVVSPPSDQSRVNAASELRTARTRALMDRVAASADPQEREQLLREVIETNMSLADAVVSRYRDRGVPVEDLRQVAYTALTRAAHRFDPGQGTDFAVFAIPTMRGEVRKYFRDHAWAVRPTRRIQELRPLVKKATDELWRELGRTPRPSEIAEHIEVPYAEVVEALGADGCYHPASLDQPVLGGPAAGSGSDGTALGELLVREEPGHEQMEARVTLAPVLKRLSERDRLILDLRYAQGLTQREIAAEIGVTQMQVSRLLTRILSDLRAGIGEL